MAFQQKIIKYLISYKNIKINVKKNLSKIK